MSESQPIESILAADIGSTLTHVCLLERVEGVYRFVAHAEMPTTLGGSENDVTIGLRQAIQRLEQVAQRDLLAGEELIIPEDEAGKGVDGFLATSSAAPPLECVLVGLTEDLSLESARRACMASQASVAEAIPIGVRGRRWDSETVSALREMPPDVVVLVGGIDAGPIVPLESAARILATIYQDVSARDRSLCIFAGNQEARRSVASVLSPVLEVRVVDNVRPSVGTESLGELQRELAETYARVKLAALPGYRRLARWSAPLAQRGLVPREDNGAQRPSAAPLPSPAILPTSEGLSATLRFIARRDGLTRGVLGADVGGTTTYIGAARSEIYQWATNASLGTSYGIDEVLEYSGLDNIERWLPVAMGREEIVSRLENARLRPYGVPQTMEDLLLTQALIRQALLLAMRRMRRQYWLPLDTRPEDDITPGFDLIAVRGGAIAHTPQDGLIALTILDAVQPTGLTRLVIDWASIWPQLGALARYAPLAAAQVLERDSFRELGTVVAPVGVTREGERALDLDIVRPDGASERVEIPGGTIRRFPLALSESVTIEVRPARHLDIGLGRKGVGGKAIVRGGNLGLIVDTRGRPLGLPQDKQLGRAKMQEWLGALIHDAHSP